MGYGAEFGLYLFDLNNNNNQYLGNPPNPAYPNPVYPNPMSTLAMRKAVAYLSARTPGITTAPVYTPVGPAYGKYMDTDIAPGGAREDLCYLYNTAQANAVLDAGGFPIGPDTWRYWDRNGNGVKDAGEGINLKIISRSDVASLTAAGIAISASLTAARVPNTNTAIPGATAEIQVVTSKNFHIYTGYRSFGVDPDFLMVWNWYDYWHPGNPPNYDGCNDAAFNAASEGVQYANDQAEAVSQAWAAQVAFATNVLSVPLWVKAGYKAVSRTYVGSTAPEVAAGYTGQNWSCFVNEPGYGVDNSWSFMNMHPEGNETGNGNDMTIRYGLSTPALGKLNPIYSDLPYDWNVLNQIYETLMVRNPYNPAEWLPWLAENFTVGTYTHPVYGTCSKVKVTLRPDATWADGTPLTTADVRFTLVELKSILAARGLPPPTWLEKVTDILDFWITDAYNFEVLLSVKSIFALSWIGSVPILPKHVWKPICTTGDPTTFAPDANMIGSGPYRLKDYVAGNYILLVANVPGSTLTTNLAGSTPITSPLGFWRYSPLYGIMDTLEHGHDAKLDSGTCTQTTTLQNDYLSGNITIDLSYVTTWPNGSVTTTNVTVMLAAGGSCASENPVTYAYGRYTLHITYLIKDPPEFASYVTLPTMVLWVTIKEDIAGRTLYDDIGAGTYPYKAELPTPDNKVDIQDLARASSAFGSYPGHSKWNPICDISGDYKVDIKDLARISAKFGWHQP